LGSYVHFEGVDIIAGFVPIAWTICCSRWI